MRPIQINIDLNDVDPDGVFEDQQAVGAGNLTLNGSGVTSGVWTTPDNFAKKIGIESAGNLSAVTFTITGFLDRRGLHAITEDVTGPNATTVETTNFFYSITSIAVDGAVGTNVEGGPVDEAVSPIIPTNWRAQNISLLATVTGTIDYTVQQTFDNIDQVGTGYDWSSIDDSNFVGATTTQTGHINCIPRAMRVIINSYSSGAALVFNLSHSDIA